ncbi:hypothetical protein [Rhizobium sp. RCAM05973]|uniref:hypothetical protein n=1 Tax=Rhizobium sp. RCAM05973 TaxID=2994066 RepID=UPI0022EBDBE8|nr:hypothetical protein [Rhizobium sp. RCAM05973]
MNATVQETRLPALMVGGSVNAIIPQSIEEMWRVSKMVVMGGLAPKALVGKKTGEEAISSVAIAIMAGAELGLPPMVALRSFTVIGGRPALYGDGIINVVRRSRKAANINTGYMENASKEAMLELGVPQWKVDTLKSAEDRSFGWCKAKRSDTGEEKTEIFSITDAKRAALWDDRQTVKKQDWNTKAWTDVPNEAPWFRYPQRMLAWRAAGYNLRELFADVLGGITDEFEAREIAGEDMRDITPRQPPTPPKPPVPPIEDAQVVETEEESQNGDVIDYGDFFERLDSGMAEANDEASIEEVWNEFDPEAILQGDDDGIELAMSIKTRRLAAVTALNGG